MRSTQHHAAREVVRDVVEREMAPHVDPWEPGGFEP